MPKEKEDMTKFTERMAVEIRPIADECRCRGGSYHCSHGKTIIAHVAREAIGEFMKSLHPNVHGGINFVTVVAICGPEPGGGAGEGRASSSC